MKANITPKIKVQRESYDVFSQTGEEAEITLYGEIVEQRPCDWYGRPVEGNFIILDDFLKDLDTISKCKAITIRIHSCGGDAAVSLLIHNRLRDLAAKGTKITGIVDGIAMSGGTHIMCACDTVKVYSNSIIMIHKCMSFLFGYYNSDELREMATGNDAYDKSQVATYKRKTGLSETVLLHMMSKTTHLTGEEIVEKGFADEVLEKDNPIKIVASADGKKVFVGNRPFVLSHGVYAPDSIPTVTPEAPNSPHASDMTNTTADTTVGKNTTEGGNIVANTVQELRDEFPELTAQLEADVRASFADSVPQSRVADATQAERQRIQEIDEVASMFSEELVAEAKYGPTACSAADLALRAAKAAKTQGVSFLTAVDADNKASGAQDVTGTPAPSVTGGNLEDEPETPEGKLAKAKANVAALLGKEEK